MPYTLHVLQFPIPDLYKKDFPFGQYLFHRRRIIKLAVLLQNNTCQLSNIFQVIVCPKTV